MDKFIEKLNKIVNLLGKELKPEFFLEKLTRNF